MGLASLALSLVQSYTETLLSSGTKRRVQGSVSGPEGQELHRGEGYLWPRFPIV